VTPDLKRLGLFDMLGQKEQDEHLHHRQ
jgi:hypothetical protein